LEETIRKPTDSDESNGKTVVSFQIDDDLLAVIDEIARKKRKYRSVLLRDIIVEYLEQEGKMPETPNVPVVPQTEL
jgi:metal-responsive CopG/Arc/MetJ family transcriptional regulator